MVDAIVGYVGWLTRRRVAALVRNKHVIARLDERSDLVAPGIGAFGEAVYEHNDWIARAACLDDVKFNSVGSDAPVTRLHAHRSGPGYEFGPAEVVG